MKLGTLLRGALYHLALPVRLAFWREHILRRIMEYGAEPCAELPDDIVCAMYRENVWTKPARPSDLDTTVRVSIAFEVVERLTKGNAFVTHFCADHKLPTMIGDVP